MHSYLHRKKICVSNETLPSWVPHKFNQINSYTSNRFSSIFQNSDENILASKHKYRLLSINGNNLIQFCYLQVKIRGKIQVVVGQLQYTHFNLFLRVSKMKVNRIENTM